MKKISLGSEYKATQISLGCMRIGNKTKSEAKKLIETALSLGINFFDNADIYCSGMSEEYFGAAVKDVDREKIIIQSKCGIRKGFYDFSKEHIVSSVEGSLKRIGTDYLDVLCLHRPDTLFEGEEVAKAFDELHGRGLVREFGVSNFNPQQIELLEKYVDYPIICNQLEFGLFHSGMVDCGICSNMKNDFSLSNDGHMLEYSRLNGITIQAWGPMRSPFGFFPDNEALKKENDFLEDFARGFGVTKEALAAAWIMRHPAKIQVLLGTTNPERLKALAKADEVELSRSDWYKIYTETGHILP